MNGRGEYWFMKEGEWFQFCWTVQWESVQNYSEGIPADRGGVHGVGESLAGLH